ncbi:hypothetical protein J1N35_010009 [Gossypium stocksii]|uniref:Uncharacterized protein n=1 Tax=Gossypium stocksii TaxID=47602 RepID=A0A9D3VZK2_9ROSI|nr:hypothetical protein J1N35_010009 [Gossypium stocksii]
MDKLDMDKLNYQLNHHLNPSKHQQLSSFSTKLNYIATKTENMLLQHAQLLQHAYKLYALNKNITGAWVSQLCLLGHKWREISKVRVSQNGSKVNHLFFADDSLLFIRNKNGRPKPLSAFWRLLKRALDKRLTWLNL